MQQLIRQIQEYESRSELLEPGMDERKFLLNKMGSWANQFIDKLPDAKAYNPKTADRESLNIGENTKSIEEIINLLEEEVAETGIKPASGGHLGYIPGGGVFSAALGDFLAAVTNEYAGVSYASPGGVAIENALINWLKHIFCFPETAVGNLASGGSISNMIALTAARDKYRVKNENIRRSVIYLSVQVHHCIQKSLRIIGLEDVLIRYVPLDEEYKMNIVALEEQILSDKKEGLNPYLIIASAGTTDTGAIDPLEAIATIARENNLWFHVDAAYGGFFILTSKKDLFKGIEKADSLVVDPHKGMFLPYGIGAVLVKDARAVQHAHLYEANYMQDALLEEWSESPANVSPELSKHFRGLRMWIPLQLHGIKPFIACLEEKLLQVQYMRMRLRDLGFLTGPEPQLSVSFFWYPSGGEENEFNRKLLNNMHEDGTVFFSSTLLNGKFVIRIAILSFRTKIKTLNKALSMISNSLNRTIKEMNG